MKGFMYRLTMMCLAVIVIFSFNIYAQKKTAATILVSPIPVEMGKIPLTSSAERGILIYNTSIQTVIISSASISGQDASQFSVTNNVNNYSLGALEKLILNVKYEPSTEASATANLVVNTNAGTYTDTLLGKGIGSSSGTITFERIYGTPQDDNPAKFVIDKNGGFLFVGKTIKADENYTDMYAIKTDKYGKILWTNSYGGKYDDAASDIVQTSDGGFLLVGNSSSFGSGQVEAYLVKIDADGNKVWEKSIGENKDIGISTIINTSDGGFLLAGNTKDTQDNSRDALLIKTDGSGNVSWKKHYGTADGESASDVKSTSDGGYIFAGSDANSSSGDFNVYVVKTDGSGNEQWSKSLGGSNWDLGKAIIQTSDGGYIVSGYTVSSGAGAEDGYLLKLDSNGKEEWGKAFGYEHNEELNGVVQTPDGGYLASGSTVTYFSTQFTYTDVYFVKTDKDGNLSWSKKMGGDKNDWAGRILKDADGAYITLGGTDSYSQSVDFFFIKINTSGEITKVSNNKLTTIPEKLSLRQNYPNPFNPSTTIQFTVPEMKEQHVMLRVYNVLGKQVATLIDKDMSSGKYNVTFNSTSIGLTSGVYFYQLKAGKYTETKKMILMK